jgi:murein DD-endopeptidase MepM/ murein hydrolase activator NlpD
MTATVAPSSTPSPTLTETPSGCPIPAGWIAYSVVSGDTVFSIATRAGSDVATLRIGNCLADADVILVDQTLYIPPRTTATPSATATIPGTEGCSAPGVLITQPLAGTTLNGVVEVRGTANITDFASYRLEIRASGDPNYREIVRVTQPVSDNVLWQLDTDAFAPGNYLLRLTALTRRRGFPQPCTIPLIFQ